MNTRHWASAATLIAAVVALLGLAPPGQTATATEEEYTANTGNAEATPAEVETENEEWDTATAEATATSETSEIGEANETWAEPNETAEENEGNCHCDGCCAHGSTGHSEALTALLNDEAYTQANNNWSTTGTGSVDDNAITDNAITDNASTDNASSDNNTGEHAVLMNRGHETEVQTDVADSVTTGAETVRCMNDNTSTSCGERHNC